MKPFHRRWSHWAACVAWVGVSVAASAAPPIHPDLATESSPASSSSSSSSSSPSSSAEVRALRLAVYDFAVEGIDPRTGRILTDAVVAELRKLSRVSVVAMDEVRAMLDLEAQKQLVGCTDESCLAEIADSLGVDGLVIGTLAVVGDSTIVGLKRLDQRQGSVVAAETQRVEGTAGEALLATVGPLVEATFKEIPLRPGKTRGVDEAIALRLNPPPVPTWGFFTAAGATSALAVGGLAAVVVNRVVVDDHNQFVKASADTGNVIQGTDVRAKQDAVFASAVSAWTLLGAAAVGAVVTGVLVPLTDWDHLADDADASGAAGQEQP